MYKVFVSSTFIDLQSERLAIIEALRKIDPFSFVGMEDFGSRNAPPKKLSEDEVDRCNLYVCIVGNRYGSGITEKEYERARLRNLPCFIYFLNPDKSKSDKKLAAFSARLNDSHTCSIVTSISDLILFITRDLYNWNNKKGQSKLLIPQDKVTEFSLYLDRNDQISNLAEFSRSEAFQNKPTIALLPCKSDDKCRLFFRRLDGGESKFDPVNNCSTTLREGFECLHVYIPNEKELDKHSSDVSPRIIIKVTIESLRSQLGASSPNPEDIRRALNERPRPLIIYCTIENKSNIISPKKQELINQWIEFWENTAGKNDSDSSHFNRSVIVIISVIENSGKKLELNTMRLRLFFTHLINQQQKYLSLKEWSAEIIRRESSFVHFKSFKALSLIRQFEVETWLKKIKEQHGEYTIVVDEALNNIARDELPDSFPMIKFKKICENKLNIINFKSKDGE